MTSPIDNRHSAIRKSSIFSRRSTIRTLVALGSRRPFFLVRRPARAAASRRHRLGRSRGAHRLRRVPHPHHAFRRPRRSRPVAAAAARAGLKFIILTDHGDGTRPPDPPAYIDGVLVLDGVEISTDEGHYVAHRHAARAVSARRTGACRGRGRPARLGGFGIAAHPDSPKPHAALDQHARDRRASSGSTSTANGATKPACAWCAPALAYLLRRGPALDAHPRPADDAGCAVAGAPRDRTVRGARRGGRAWRRGPPGRRSRAKPCRQHRHSELRGQLRRLQQPRHPATAAVRRRRRGRAQRCYAAIRKGQCLLARSTAMAGPALLDFWVEAGFDRQPMGAVLPEDSDATLVARANVPAGSEISILRNGRGMANNARRRAATRCHRWTGILPGRNPGAGRARDSPGPLDRFQFDLFRGRCERCWWCPGCWG